MGHHSRRKFLAGAAAAASFGPLIVTDRTRAQTRTLRVNTYGGSWTAAQDVAMFKPFTAATGIAIKPVTPVMFAKLRAQVQTGNYEWDVTSINLGEWTRADRAGLAEPIDWGVVKRDALPPDVVASNGISGLIEGTNLVYRSDKFPPGGGPKSWADFWDVKRFPGPRSLCSRDSTRSLIFALIADGVPKDKLYPLDLERGFRKLDQIKPHIKVWWDGGNQSQQLLRDGEVHMMSMWNARLTELKREGVPVEIVWDGAYMVNSMWGVVKGTPNHKMAWEFIQFVMQPGPQAEFSKHLFYGPTQPAALALMPPDIAREMPTWPANAALSVKQDAAWEGAHLDAIEERFNQWLAT
jgi:putative spermidine/putrescine transport system substrate-binding protein